MNTSDPQLAIGMWTAMMAAMMLPGAVPTIIRISGYRSRIVFVAAYLAVWGAFGAAAAALQLVLESRHLLTSDMALRSAVAANLSLLVIGAYQLTPAKRACLRLCRSEVVPLRYAFACLGASWLLMGILFVVGVMSVIWVAALALWIAAEKTLSAGGRLAAAAGVGLAGPASHVDTTALDLAGGLLSLAACHARRGNEQERDDGKRGMTRDRSHLCTSREAVCLNLTAVRRPLASACPPAPRGREGARRRRAARP